MNNVKQPAIFLLKKSVAKTEQNPTKKSIENAKIAAFFGAFFHKTRLGFEITELNKRIFRHAASFVRWTFVVYSQVFCDIVEVVIEQLQ